MPATTAITISATIANASFLNYDLPIANIHLHSFPELSRFSCVPHKKTSGDGWNKISPAVCPPCC